MPRIERMRTMVDRDPERGQLMIEEKRLGFKLHMLAEQYEKADDAERPAMRDEIRQHAAERLDLQQQLRRSEIERLEKRLDEIKVRLDADLDRREELIEETLDDLGVLP